MRRPTPHPALRQLDILVGEWDMWAAGRSVGPFWTAWLEGGAFLVQRADVDPGTALPGEWATHAPFPTVALTGYDDTADEFTVLYPDGRGVARVYHGSMTDRTWRQWRTAPGFHQRLSATVSAGGDRMEGGWERSSDGADWATDRLRCLPRAADCDVPHTGNGTGLASRLRSFRAGPRRAIAGANAL